MTDLSIMGILQAALALYRKNFSSLAGIVLLSAPFSILLTSVSQSAHYPLATAELIALLGVLAVTLLISLLMQSSLLFFLDQANGGTPPGILESYRNGLRFIFPIIIFGLLFAGVWLAGAIIGAVLSIFLCCSLLIIPFFIFILVKAMVALPAIVIERKDGFAGFKRSWNLTQNHFWFCFGVGSVLAGMFILETAFWAPFDFLLKYLLADHLSVAQVLSSIISQGVAVVVSPLIQSILVFLFYSLRIRSESGLRLPSETTQALPATGG